MMVRGSKIDRLSIEGYKSIKKLEGFELKNINLLIGANGSGKSNFVSFFTMLHELVEGNLQGYIETNGRADAHLFLGPKITEEIAGELCFGGRLYHGDWGMHRYNFQLIPTVDNKLIIKRDEGTFTKPDNHDFSISKVYTVNASESGLKAPTQIQALHSYIYSSVSEWTIYHFHDTSNTARMRRDSSTRDFDYLRNDAGNIAAFLMQMKSVNNASYENIRDTIRNVAPFFDDFLFRPKTTNNGDLVSLEWRQQGSDFPFQPYQLSDGTMRFICLATVLLQPNPPATIIIDEPELGLHPFALKTLAALIRKASQNTQLIISTQSSRLVDEFTPEDIVVLDLVDKATVFNRLDEKELAKWLVDYSLGEIWEKNIIGGKP